MYWEELIKNLAICLGTSTDVAGLFLSFSLVASILISAFIVTRGRDGTQSHGKIWFAIVLVISIVIFTYPFGWIPIWYGMIMILAIAVTVGYATSKTAGGGD